MGTTVEGGRCQVWDDCSYLPKPINCVWKTWICRLITRSCVSRVAEVEVVETLNLASSVSNLDRTEFSIAQLPESSPVCGWVGGRAPLNKRWTFRVKVDGIGGILWELRLDVSGHLMRKSITPQIDQSTRTARRWVYVLICYHIWRHYVSK